VEKNGDVEGVKEETQKRGEKRETVSLTQRFRWNGEEEKTGRGKNSICNNGR